MDQAQPPPDRMTGDLSSPTEARRQASGRGQDLERQGPDAFETDHELLVFILRLVSASRPSNATATQLLSDFGSFARVVSASAARLARAGYLTHSQILVLKTIQATTLGQMRLNIWNRSVFQNWDSMCDYLVAAQSREEEEHFRVMFLDRRRRLIWDEVLARGTVNHVHFEARQIFARALELRASSVILAHNHPSGDPEPSTADIEHTLLCIAAGKWIGIPVKDHVIIGNGVTVSLRRHKYIKRGLWAYAKTRDNCTSH